MKKIIVIGGGAAGMAAADCGGGKWLRGSDL